MSQHNQRQEPTSGESSQATLDFSENEQVVPKKPQPAKLSLSLHSTTSPGHTFTPLMKHPKATTPPAEQTPIAQEAATQNNGGFAFAPIVENPAPLSEMAEPKVSIEPQVASLDAAQSEPLPNVAPVSASASTMERVIPTQTGADKTRLSEKAPTIRRLLVVLLILLALILIFFLLKPKTPESVENLEQSSSLPAEFRPIDEEEAKRAEAEAKALQEAQAQQRLAEQQAQAQQQAELQNQTQPPAQAVVAAPAIPEPPVFVAQPVEQKAVDGVLQMQPSVKAPQPPQSVIHQPEVAVKPEPVAKPQAVKSAAKIETAKIETVKPVATVTKSESKAVNLTAVSTKTMTVPQGVSLMQVFRNHHLNVSDVNAMDKVNKAVSKLKMGEKITVKLDKNNRITELSIGSGGKYIRQANGNYIYQK